MRDPVQVASEHRECGAGTFPHHRFERYSRHVDPLPHFGAAQQALSAIGHTCGRAFEGTRCCGGDAGNRPIVSLSPSRSRSPAPPRPRVTLPVGPPLSPIIQERAERQQREGSAAQRFYGTQRIVPVAFGGNAGLVIDEALYTFSENIETEVVPATVSAHLADGRHALLREREAELTMGELKKRVRAGAFVHMPPETPHILAKTVATLLLMLNQVRLKKGQAPAL